MVVRVAAVWLWLVALAPLSAWAQTDQHEVTWPECRETNHFRSVPRGTLDLEAEILYIQYCNITSLEPRSFSNLPNLLNLRLGWNNIAKLDVGLLNPLTKLKVFTIKSNQFLGKDLPPNLFNKNRKLEEIHFAVNDMNDAPFDLLQGLGNLKTLNLFKCSLYQVPLLVTQPVLKSLRELSLSYNLIQMIDNPDTFTRVATLSSLHLARNQIHYLHEDVFKPLTLLEIVYLHNNKIRYLPGRLFKHHQFLRIINLEGNLIEYIPANAFLNTNITELDISDNKLTYLPDDLYSAFTINPLTFFKFIHNPWQCACLNEMLVRLKRSGILYSTEGFDGKQSVCEMTDYPCIKTFRIAIP